MRRKILKKQKLIFHFALSLILSGSFLSNVFAQNVITKEDFETVKSKAKQNLKKISYRSTASEKAGELEKTTIYEFIPPDRKHSVINGYHIPIGLDSSGKIVSKPAIKTYDEWIYIGEKIYHRNGAKKTWQEIIPNLNSGYGSGTGTGSEKPIITTEYKLTRNQIVNQQECDLYEVVVSTKYSASAAPFIETSKYWVNKDGLFVKTQITSGSWGGTVVDYDYNSKIKIEAPLIKRTKKSI